MSGYLNLLLAHLKKSHLKKDLSWLFTTTKDGLAINVYNTTDRELVGAVITSDRNSKKVFLKKGAITEGDLELLKKEILTHSPFCELEV